MNFAPYQDESPEAERALSPPPPFADLSNNHSSQNQYHHQNQSPPYHNSAVPSSGGYGYANHYQQQPQGQSSASWTTGFGNTSDPEGQRHHYRGYGGRADLDAFETSLPLRVDYEAMLAYLLLPPAGGVILLLLEHKSDYVRFHAWQSSMLFSAIFVRPPCFSLCSHG